MSSPVIIDPRYPIGKFCHADTIDRASEIFAISALPELLRTAVTGLTRAQIDTPYREGGWTVGQIVHHISDTHMDAYLRTRLALTEEWPTVKLYDGKLRAELPDARTAGIEMSLRMIEALHARWVTLLRALTEEQCQRGYAHPENGRQSLMEFIAICAWHGRHHTAQITETRKRNAWCEV